MFTGAAPAPLPERPGARPLPKPGRSRPPPLTNMKKRPSALRRLMFPMAAPPLPEPPAARRLPRRRSKPGRSLPPPQNDPKRRPLAVRKLMFPRAVPPQLPAQPAARPAPRRLLKPAHRLPPPLKYLKRKPLAVMKLMFPRAVPPLLPAQPAARPRPPGPGVPVRTILLPLYPPPLNNSLKRTLADRRRLSLTGAPGPSRRRLSLLFPLPRQQKYCWLSRSNRNWQILFPEKRQLLQGLPRRHLRHPLKRADRFPEKRCPGR